MVLLRAYSSVIRPIRDRVSFSAVFSSIGQERTVSRPVRSICVICMSVSTCYLVSRPIFDVFKSCVERWLFFCMLVFFIVFAFWVIYIMPCFQCYFLLCVCSSSRCFSARVALGSRQCSSGHFLERVAFDVTIECVVTFRVFWKCCAFSMLVFFSFQVHSKKRRPHLVLT